MALAAQNLAHGLARDAGGSRHSFDGHALLGKVDNLPMKRLTDLRTIPLEAFGTGQSLRIDLPRLGQRPA